MARRCEGGDEWQTSVPLRVVESESDDELVGNLDSDVANLRLDDGGVGLAEHRGDLDRGRSPRSEVRDEPRERAPRGDDVLDDQDVAPRDVGVEILENPDDARGLGPRAV